MTKDSTRPPRKPKRRRSAAGADEGASSTAVPALRDTSEIGSAFHPATLVRSLLADRELAYEDRVRTLVASLADAFATRDDKKVDRLVEAGYSLLQKDLTKKRRRFPVELECEFRFYAGVYWALLKREIDAASNLVEDMPDDARGRLARAAIASVTNRESLARMLVGQHLRDRVGSGDPPLPGEERLIGLIERNVLIL